MFQLDAILPRHTKKLLATRSKAQPNCNGQHRNFADNSNHFGTVGTDQNYHDYPDDNCCALRQELAEMQQISPAQTLICNGATEAFDLILRAFVSPDKDNVMLFNPTESLYKELVLLNSATVNELNLTHQFQLPIYKIKKEINEYTKIILVSNPNPISGLPARPFDLVELLDIFNGLVVIDETYIDFCSDKSMLKLIKDYPNLLVVHSFSKGYGLAGLRLGAIFANEKIINVLAAVKLPYSVNTAAQTFGLKALHVHEYRHRLSDLMRSEREHLRGQLLKFPFVKEISNSEANFLLVKVENAARTYEYLQKEKIDVYLCLPSQQHCEQSLRITIGTSEENRYLLQALEDMSYKLSPVRNFLKAVTSNFSKVGSVLAVFKKFFG